jgi:VanZ family protein
VETVNNLLQAVREKNRRGIVCGIAVMAVLVATLWPFNPFPPNRVRWLTGANGIGFDGAGLVISKAPLIAAEIRHQQSCTLEILLRPAAIKSLYTILSFYTPNNPGQFLVRQWTDGLLVSHDVVDATNKLKRRKFDVDHAFQIGKLLLLTIVSGPDGTVVYTDGRQTQIFPRFTISQSELSGQIVIGTSPVDYQPWAGEIRGFAIYSSELTPVQVFKHYKGWTASPGVDPPDLSGAVTFYSFTERTGREVHNAVVSGPDLEIPKNFAVPHKALLASPMKEFQASRRYLKDLLLNVGGFVPLGFVICAYLASTRSQGKAILYTVLAAGTLSFVIEVLQAYIPQRVSGTTDIITNSLGGVIGAVLARAGAVRRFL